MLLGLFLGSPFTLPASVVSADSGSGGAPVTPTMLPATQAATYVGTPTEWRFVFTGETPFVHPIWSIVSGSLPEGMTFLYPASGATADRMVAKISGTPRFYGVYPIVLRADPGYIGGQVEKSYSLGINPMDVPPTVLPTARAGVSYGFSIPVVGGMGPYVWTMDSGELPQGMSFSSSGFLSGTPVFASGTTFTVMARDMGGRTASRQFSLTVDPDQALAISTLSVPTGSVGQGFSTTFSGLGGTAPYRWDLGGGPFPPGLTLTAAGRLYGTFTTAGTYRFTLKLTDAFNRTVTQAYTMVVGGTGSTGASTLVIGASSLPAGTVGTWYGYNVGISGGTAPYAWTVTGGSVPSGLTFEAGSLYGTPTAAGTYTFTIRAADASSASVSQTVTVTVNGATSTGSTGAGTSAGTGTGTSSGTGTGATATAETEIRVRNLDRLGLSINSLVKLPDDGNPVTQEDTAVYFIGNDGRRHAFPNGNVFFTWYANFNDVRVVSAATLASIPLGRNVTYRSGVRMVKFTTDARVYAVSTGRVLRPIGSEDVARALYGASWNRQIDDIADTFYTDYNFGTEIRVSTDFGVASIRDAVMSISDTLGT